MGVKDQRDGRFAQDILGGDVSCSLPFPGQPPLMIEPASGSRLKRSDVFADWFRERRQQIDTLLDEYGAIRWRGFGLADTRDFERLIDHYPQHEQGYVGGSTPRNRIGDSTKVFEATQAAPDMYLGLHQEMAYLPHYPGKLVFFCRQPADEGGETLVGDMRRFTEMLPDRLLAEIDERGVRYLRNFRPAEAARRARDESDGLRILHMTLEQGFSTADPSVVEAHCRDLGLAFKWEPDGSVTTIHYAPGLVDHGSDRVWFNVIHSQQGIRSWLGEDWWSVHHKAYRERGQPLPYYVEYGDGGDIDQADLQTATELLDSVTVFQPWRAGDVLQLDNVITAHGRNRFTGRRDVQTVLLA